MKRPSRSWKITFIKGHSWEDFPHFCRELARFTTEVLDRREHHTTHQPPLERFAEELPHLTPLPAPPGMWGSTR